ncbi:MAG: cysteine hydrolase family protein [Ktedonobacteraceae bacterium]
MPSLAQNTVLLIIDVQQGFDDPSWGSRNNPQAEENIARLLETWRRTDRPIIHVQHLSKEEHSPLGADTPGSQFKSQVQPQAHELIIQKQVNSAFIGTHLEQILHTHHFDSLVIVGLTTDHCVSTTTRMAGNLGFHTYVVSDATATFERTGYDGRTYTAEEIHTIALVSLHHEFATVLDTQGILAMVNAH